MRYSARGGGLAMFLTERETVLAGRGSAIRMKLEGSRMETALEALDRQPGISNYYRGNDPKRWRVGVPHYAKVVRRGVYDGIDVAYYGNGRRIEYDFVVAPGADPGVIRLAYDGAEKIQVDGGDLVLSTRAGEFRQHKPLVYQEVAGRRVEVEARYRLRGVEVGFELAGYDRSKAVVIDPVLTYGTYLGGSSFDSVFAVGVSPTDNAIYVTGQTLSTDFPLVSPVDSSQVLGDAFVTKMAANGQTLLFSTYFGGSGTERPASLAVHAAGDVVVCGTTDSRDLSLVNPVQTSPAPSFVARFGSSGAIVYSTYLGGSGIGLAADSVSAVAFDAAGNAYVAGKAQSADFPGFVPGAGGDGFIIKLSPSGSSRLFSMRLGGSRADEIRSMAVDNSGVYVTGSTESLDFPATGGFQRDGGGSWDAFVTKVKLDGSGILYSSYLGGNQNDAGNGIAVGPDGSAYVTGGTGSTDFPVRNAAFPRWQGLFDAFVAKISPAGESMLYSTFIGGSDADSGAAIAVAGDGSAAIIGSSASTDLPSYGALYWNNKSRNSVFVAKLTSSGTLRYLTFFDGSVANFPGGIALLGTSEIVIGGSTSGTLPLRDAYNSALAGWSDAFIARLADGPSPVRIAVTTSPAGRRFEVDGVTYTGSATFGWQPGVVHSLNALSPQTDGSAGYVLTSWSQGGAAVQSIVAPSVDTTYTATYSSAGCTYSFGAPSVPLDAEGSWKEVNWNTADGCPWEITSTASWIRFPSGPNAGPLRMRIGAETNLSGPRTGELRFAGRTLTVTQSGGRASLAAPRLAVPEFFTPLAKTTFSWQPVVGATGYEVLMRMGVSYTGPPTAYHEFRPFDAPTSVTLELPSLGWTIYVRACAGGFSDDTCGPYAASGTLWSANSIPAPTILSPLPDQIFRSSTQEFRWQPVPGATSYEVALLDLLDPRGVPEMQIRTPGTSTIYSMKGSGRYLLRVVSCTDGCGFGSTVTFVTNLPPIPVSPPTITSTTNTGGNSYRFTWTAVTGADIYRIAAIQPNSGPGGGALTVASTQTTATDVTMTIPPGQASVIVAACNGRGCGPYSAPASINPSSAAPAAPILGQPIPVTNVDGPFVLFTWSRVPGDNGSNTQYRLYAQDLSRGRPGLDVQTTNNFYGALFTAEGRRYDAVVAANPGPSQTVGPPTGFIVQGTSPTSPTPVAPTHGGQVPQGTVGLEWTPVSGASFYQWAVFRAGDSSMLATGLTPLTSASARLPPLGAGARYSLIVRACPGLIADGCLLGSDAVWGPWSNSAGGGGVTNFTVVP
ncbi:MAG: SBBP repeat-containing protein [Bryobacteraceae bacterium]